MPFIRRLPGRSAPNKPRALSGSLLQQQPRLAGRATSVSTMRRFPRLEWLTHVARF